MLILQLWEVCAMCYKKQGELLLWKDLVKALEAWMMFQ